MTEAEWRAATDPTLMLEFLKTKVSDRKLRLFAVACCRRIWAVLKNERSRRAVEVAERFADRLTEAGELHSAFTQASVNAIWNQTGGLHAASKARLTSEYHYSNGYAASVARHAVLASHDVPAEWVAQCGIIRDIFGNPFRPVLIDISWESSTVLALAQQMYDSRDFTEMPILADALQDTGCDNEDILNHCRGENVHVRGCFVIDLVLGKG
jgi:hypothetical protein